MEKQNEQNGWVSKSGNDPKNMWDPSERWGRLRLERFMEKV